MKVMSHSIKCLHCMTWNTGVDYCVQCKALLNPVMLKEIEEEEKRIAYENRTLTSADKFILKIKNSNNWLIKGIYLILHSVWLAFAAIVSFLMALVALAPG